MPPVVRPVPFATPVGPRGMVADSVYIMEGVEPNGEIQKTTMPVYGPNTTNSLMVDSKDMVPVSKLIFRGFFELNGSLALLFFRWQAGGKQTVGFRNCALNIWTLR